MRLDTIDMERIYAHQPMYVRFFNIFKDEITEKEWNSFIAMPMLVKQIYVRGCSETLKHAKLQYPVVIHESAEAYMGKRNDLIVELDITTKCNLSCPNCVRFSNFHSTWESMDMLGIYDFIARNKQYGKKLTVKIIGGEPTIHPNIVEILTALNEHFHLMIATNGINKWVPPFDMVVENSAKERGVLPEFHPTCDAPIDDIKYQGEDFSFGCDTAYTCMNVCTSEGYYPCTVAGSIDRMLRLPGGPREGMPPLATTNLTECISDTNKVKVFSNLCGYCGFYKKMGFHEAVNKTMVRTTEQVYSKSWKFMDGKK